jgi:hypothetical protein
MDRPLIETMMSRVRDIQTLDELQDVLTEIAAGALFIAHANGLPVGQIAQRASMMVLMTERTVA